MFIHRNFVLSLSDNLFIQKMLGRDLHLKMQFSKLQFGKPLENKEKLHAQLHEILLYFLGANQISILEIAFLNAGLL